MMRSDHIVVTESLFPAFNMDFNIKSVEIYCPLAVYIRNQVFHIKHLDIELTSGPSGTKKDLVILSSAPIIFDY